MWPEALEREPHDIVRARDSSGAAPQPQSAYVGMAPRDQPSAWTLLWAPAGAPRSTEPCRAGPRVARRGPLLPLVTAGSLSFARAVRLERLQSRLGLAGWHARKPELLPPSAARNGPERLTRWSRLLAPAAATAATATRRARGTTAAVTAKPATAATATPATTTPAASGRTPLARDVHGDGPPVERRPVQRLDGTFGLFVRVVLHEAKSAGLTCCSVNDHAR